MKFFVKVSNAMQHFATRKNIITLLVVLAVILLTMKKSPVGSSALKELSGGSGMLDMQFGYNQLQVYNMLETIGYTGRQLYANLLGLDFVFAVVFMLFQSLMITTLLRKAAVNKHFIMLNLLPFVRSALDMIENCFILALLFNYPVRLPLVVEIASIVTTLKWIIYVVIIALVLSLGVLTTWKTINSKIKLQKWSENI